jgi:molybdopterin molybdotransferase
MIQFKDAQSLITNLAREIQLETESVSLEQADGRICSQNILSPEAVPSFNNSAMDGFAIRAIETQAATEKNPICLKVVSIIAAGDEITVHGGLSSTPHTYSDNSQAIEIMTGAVMPDIFDAVVKIEDVETHNEKGTIREIVIRSAIPKGNNIREKGTDYQVGQIVLPQGTMIRPESMMALASLGVSEVCVFKKPRVVILSTGKELVPASTKNLKPGMIRNSTAIYLKTALTHLGAEVVHADSMGDESENFAKHITQVLDQNIDIMVTTGAVSMGKFDFIPSVLRQQGAEILFHKVAIRPGKPILLARIPRKGRNPLVVFGMPGNPVSSAVGLRFFLTPFFRELNRQKPEKALQVKLSQTTSKPEGLKCFFKARLENNENGLGVAALSGQASFMVSPLVQANSWVLFSEAGSTVCKNEDVFVYPLLPDQAFNMEYL